MAMIDFDSFDTGVINSSWLGVGGGGTTLNTSVKRTGIASMAINLNNESFKSFTGKSEVYCGFAVWIDDVFGTDFFTMYSDTHTVSHINLSVDSGTAHWQLNRGIGGTNIASDPGNQVVLQRWYYIEVRATIDNTIGICQVWIDGVLTFDYVGDTRNGGASTLIDSVGLSGGSTGNTHLFDDFYVLDTTGATNNTRLGDVDVVTLRPNGNGTHSQLVGSDGNSTDNYLLVDDPSTPVTSDYVTSTVIGNKDTYALASAPVTAVTVYAVRPWWHGKKMTNGTALIKPVTIASGSTTTGTAQALSTTDGMYQGTIADVDPSGATWTVDTLNAAEVGVEIA